MQPQLQRVEVEALRPDDHDLAVEDTAVRQALEQRLVELREVPIERPRVAALEVELARAAAKDERAETVPRRLVQPSLPLRQLVRELCQHGLDRRGDRGVGNDLPSLDCEAGNHTPEGRSWASDDDF